MRGVEAAWRVFRFLGARFQLKKARLVGLGFKKINPVVLWITPSGCRAMLEKHHFSVLTHLNPVSQPMKTPTKIQDVASFFIFYSTVSKKMDHFDISFACSIFSKSWEVINYGFLLAHLPVSHQAQHPHKTNAIPLSSITTIRHKPVKVSPN